MASALVICPIYIGIGVLIAPPRHDRPL